MRTIGLTLVRLFFYCLVVLFAPLVGSVVAVLMIIDTEHRSIIDGFIDAWIDEAKSWIKMFRQK